MQGFARRHTVAAALTWLDAQLRTLDAEDVPLRTAAGRVLAESITSDIDIPGFDRATMDGYAVVADSTAGATSYNRIPLSVIGDALPGSPFADSVSRGEAVRIMAWGAVSRLIAKTRSSRESRAFHTSPIPPAPIGATSSYGPSLTPACHALTRRF